MSSIPEIGEALLLTAVPPVETAHDPEVVHPPSLNPGDEFAGLRRRGVAGSQKTASTSEKAQGEPQSQPRLDTYGVTEFRDGFFDALFFNTAPAGREALLRHAEETLPVAFHKKDPLSLKRFVPRQWHEAKNVVRRVATTRSGVRLVKSFLGFIVAYIICLVPVARAWLGRYSYILVVSGGIVNHPGRTLGAQLDGALLTILGVGTGLGWGAFGLWLSTSSLEAQIGYGGILALFLCLYMAVVACIRSYYIRFYQFALCAGIAVAYTCLAETHSQNVAWSKLLNFGIPWVLGQVISLIICAAFFPDAGARPLAVSLHDAFQVMLNGLAVQNPDRLSVRRRLAQTFVNVSQAYRDLVIDVTVTSFHPKDVLELRNLLQGVVRSLLALRPDSGLFGYQGCFSVRAGNASSTTQGISGAGDASSPPPRGGNTASGNTREKLDGEDQIAELVRHRLGGPTNGLILSMREALERCDAVLMDLSGHRGYLGPPAEVSTDLASQLIILRQTIEQFDAAEASLLEGEDLPTAYSSLPEVVWIFTCCRPIRQAAAAVEALVVKAKEMQQRKPALHVRLPSHPFWRALSRTNAQVRHDRGGVTAGSYYRIFEKIASLLEDIKSRDHHPLPKADDYHPADLGEPQTSHAAMEADLDSEPVSKAQKFRHKLWTAVHRLQGPESRYALKVVMVTSLLSIPAWLPQSRDWWNQYESWWAVVMSWIMMHSRIGGNFQDLVTRSVAALMGALWSAAAYAAGRGNPYVMAVFATLYMLPMLYRFTQSSHARSGLVGCLSFTVISLGLVTADGQISPVSMAVTRGCAFVVGVVAAIFVNWLLWPFVARHELRKAVSSMMFFLSIIYRSVVARYVYYGEGHAPDPESIQRSEIVEGRLREGFVRIRQLMALTRHEIRLRAPFDPLPYSALTESCERFFEYLVALRQSALFFHPRFVRGDNDEAAERLLSFRRDAVASVIGNLYVLAGALRSARKVPKYLPSTAAARGRLLDKMEELKLELGLEMDSPPESDSGDKRRRWWQIYSYSFNESLTGCAVQLEELEKYTKLIVGEDGIDSDSDDSSDSGPEQREDAHLG